MSHLHYEEEQRFSNKRWIWFVLFFLFLLPIIMALTEEEPNQKDMTMILLSTVFAILPVAAILLYSKFQIKIDNQGIHYKFFPAVIKWRVISKDMIESFEVTAKQTLLEKVECGYRRNRLNNTIVMNISGEKFARIKLKDGRRLKIGSENPEGLARALRKLTSPDNQ